MGWFALDRRLIQCFINHHYNIYFQDKPSLCVEGILVSVQILVMMLSPRYYLS